MGKNSGLSNEIKLSHMKQLAEYRGKLRKAPKLHSLFIELTGVCNEHCRHCGSSCGDFKVENLLSTQEIKDFLDQIKSDFDITELQLCVTGGEPLLREDFLEIMNYAKSKGFSWGMTSNGILINQKMAVELRKAGMKTISISLDGLRETHDWFRQKEGSFDLACQGIRNLINEGGFKHVQVTTVVYHKNIDELEDMYQEFKRLGAHSWRVINMEPIGRAMSQPELMLSKEEYKKLFDFIEKKRFEDPRFPVTYGCSHYLGVDMERELRKWYFLCNAGVYTASVMYNGDIGACLDVERRPETIQGNIRKQRFKDVWEKEFEIFRTDYRKAGICADCPDYQYCAGDSFHTWDFDKMSPKICLKDICK